MKYYADSKLKNVMFVSTLFAPSVAILLIVVAYPLVRSFALSLTSYNIIHPASHTFIGLKNYVALWNDEIFWEALKNTLIFNVSSVFGGFLIGFVLALLLHTNIRFRRIFRGILLTPWVIPYVVIGFLFLYMFNTKIGIVNYTLQRIGLIAEFLPWLAKPALAMTAVIIANIWNQFPFHLTTMLAGLQTIPDDCIEAARIDGAGSVAVFRYITFPWLRNIIVISTTLMMIQNFNNFALIWSITGGGPINSTTTFVIYVFQKAFEEFNFGYASAIGMVWMALLVVFAYVYMKFAVKEVN
jgi:multiple sugar transport system permease protein